MDLDFTEEQAMLRDMVRGVCGSYASLETVRAMEGDPIGDPVGFWKQLAELDLIGLMIPTEDGGPGVRERAGGVGYPGGGRDRLRGVRARARALAALCQRGDDRGPAAARGNRSAEARVAAADRDR